MSNVPERIEQLPPLQRAVFALKELRSQLDALEKARTEPVAVVGIGCRFPGAAGPEAFWRLLCDGAHAVSEVPPERWDLREWYAAEPGTAGKMVTRWGGFLADLDQFDPLFFGIAPREAVSLDPQQRLLLEVAWEALEHAGIAPDRLAGSPAGVFVGVGPNEYARQVGEPARIDSHVLTGNAVSVAAGRLAYVLGLQGPVLAVDTACSSSLVAVHLACQGLRTGECRLALAGGVNVLLAPDSTVALSEMGALSPGGRCKTFDARADGYVRGEGCGVVVLKRLSDALTDGDEILALIRGSATNHDGRSAGLTVPNGPAQESVLRAALAAARVEPGRVQYVEAHGTGTPLGDPIEVRALAAVYGPGRPGGQPLSVGSVKTNVGHLEAAAGIAGLIKVVLALRHGQIPPHLHFQEPNPHLPWKELPVAIPLRLTPWPAAGPRLAGVSSFGFSGTNAHAVLEEAPPAAGRAAVPDRPCHLLVLSARDGAALRELAARYADHLAAHPDENLADVCFTASVGRAHFAHRAAVVADSLAQARERLSALAEGRDEPGLVRGEGRGNAPPRVALLFTGQGSQYAGMGRQLYETCPPFRRELDRCADLLRPHLDRPLLDVIYPAEGTDSPLGQTGYTQPALFALEYALAQLWLSWGVEPFAVLGHSLGEYVAACVAGVLTLEDALKLVATRARLMQGLPPGGAMAAVRADEPRVGEAISPFADRLSIAALNGPSGTVVSGEAGALEEVLARLGREGVAAQRLDVSHAFHSPLMGPILGEFRRAAEQARHDAPQVSLASNLTGKLFGSGERPDADYWCRHLRQPVRFADGVKALREAGVNVFVEVGPGTTLLGMARHCLPGDGLAWLPSLRKGQDDWPVLLESLGRLYVLGAPVDGAAFDGGYPRRKVALPTYPFQRQRYWLTSAAPRPRAPFVREGQAGAGATLPGQRLSSPLKQTVFESSFGAEVLPFLADHRVHGRVVVAGAAHVSLLLAAAREALGAGPCLLGPTTFPQALILPEKELFRVQVVLSPGEGRAAAFEVFSCADGGPQSWTLHAAGQLDQAEGGAVPLSVDDLRSRCPEPLPAPEFYRALAEHGVELGPAFRWIDELWRGDGEALCRMRAPRDAAEGAVAPLHPGLVDSCVQLVVAAFSARASADATGPFIPVGFERFRFAGPATFPLWAHARLRPSSDRADEFTGDVTLLGEDGQVVTQWDALRFRRAPRAAFLVGAANPADDLLCCLRWEPQEPVAGPGPGGRWLLVGDGGLGSALSGRLTETGATCLHLLRGQPFDEVGPERFHHLLAEADARGGAPLSAIVLLAGLDETARGRSLRALLFLVQALARRAGPAPRLWVLTRGSQPAGDPTLLAVEQAPLWGLAHVVALEHPELRCTCIDLDPAAPPGEVGALVDEFRSAGAEDQVALRGGQRLVARLGPAGPPRDRLEPPAGIPCRLEVGSPGVLGSLTLRPAERRAPRAHEVEIRVRSTGLNFRDVLNALGMYPGDPGPLGLECAGTVTAVGEEVGLEVGDDVLAMAPGSFGTFVTTDARLAARTPAGLDFEDAAAIPVVFLTAHYGLNHLARLQPGERVLVHAAAGGVGLAAVQLARRAGAEVLATAGSPAKRAFLRERGIEHVFDSRSLAFADGARAATGGRGVDVVLNSLAGEFIPRSLDVLAPGGRFLEIGKIDIWGPQRVAEARPDVAYFVIALDRMGVDDPALVGSLLREVLEGFADGSLRPLPRHVFALAAAPAAFRFMAQARHTGKIVLSQGAEGGPVRGGATYLVTGGLGALGLRVAGWLAARGARHLVLLGRRGPSPEAGAAIGGLERAGVRVIVARADVAEEDELGKVLAETRATMPPLRGVVHAAGTLDDGVLLEQSWQRFGKVLAPKVAGAWNLHELTRALPLDFFVMFSSAASLLGSPGQGNYAAGNAFLDALAHHRRALGLPALSVNWGPWAGEGMAAGLGDRERRRWEARGMGLIDPEQGLAQLERALGRDEAQLAVLPVDWPRFLRSATTVPPLLSALARQPAAAALPSSEIVERLRQAPAGRRRDMLVGFLREQAGKVLGLAAGHALGNDQPLHELGLDSLLAVELRNVLGAALGRTLPATVLFNYPSVGALAGWLEAELFGPAEPPANGGRQPPGEDEESRRAEVEGLSEAELDDLLEGFAEKHLKGAEG